MRKIRDSWRHLPLRFKFTAVATILVVAVALALTTFTINNERATFQTELRLQATALLDVLAHSAREPLYLAQINDLATLATVAGHNENLAGVRIFDETGVVLADDTISTTSLSQDIDPLGSLLSGLGADATYVEMQDDRLIAGRPVFVGRQRLGSIAVSFSTAPLTSKVNAVAGVSLAVAGRRRA